MNTFVFRDCISEVDVRALSFILFDVHLSVNIVESLVVQEAKSVSR